MKPVAVSSKMVRKCPTTLRPSLLFFFFFVVVVVVIGGPRAAMSWTSSTTSVPSPTSIRNVSTRMRRSQVVPVTWGGTMAASFQQHQQQQHHHRTSRYCRSSNSHWTSRKAVTDSTQSERDKDKDDDGIKIAYSRSDDDHNNIWEQAAMAFIDVKQDPSQMPDFVQCVSLLRVLAPSILWATAAKVSYPILAMQIAQLINNDDGVFAVIAQDASQYIQNILTTSGLVFSLLVGQTYYFMYQQQEKIYLALFEEVTMAKSLLEQVALVCQGRESLYERILECIDKYVRTDLTCFNDKDPAVMLSERPMDDPLEDILFLTSVGEPSIVYQTVKSLRQARANRLGALQRKLPSIHMVLLWTLAVIVLCTFPLLGAGSQTIGGPGILVVQSWYVSFIVLAIHLTMGVIYELRRPGEPGAYNARSVLSIMVTGLEQELEQRRKGELGLAQILGGPSVDSDGSFDADVLLHPRHDSSDSWHR